MRDIRGERGKRKNDVNVVYMYKILKRINFIEDLK